MRARRALALLAGSALLLAGGGGVAGASRATKQIDACTLITPEDIAEILGIDGATKNEQVSSSSPGYCAYDLPATPVGGLLTVGVGRFSAVTKKDLAANSKQDGAQKIPGVKKGFYIVAEADETSPGVTRPAGSEADLVIGKKFMVIQILTVEVGEDAFLELIDTARGRV